MALKQKYKDVKEIPAGDERHYVERGGEWVLDAEGDGSKAKLEEFRLNNIAQKKLIEDLNARFEGIDPEEVRKLVAEKLRLEEERQLKAGEVEKVMESRIKGMREDWEKQVTGMRTENESLTSRLTTVQIDQGVITTATKRGLRPTALPDITARARSVFKLVNGSPRAFEADGQTVRYGKDGVSPMTLEEWVDAQVSDAPHLFESNAGSGAAGNPAGGGTGGNRSVKNPFRRETWNLTEQMRLTKKEPGLAARFEAAV